MSKIIVHADDYAISDHVSESLEQQIKAGAVQSVSLMPNLKSTERGAALLAPFADQVFVSIHLNLVEGKCVADPKQLDRIADEDGYFKLSWLGILLRSTDRAFLKQVRIEFKAQIKRCRALLQNAGFKGRLRLDSHQHIHMIPGIFAVAVALAGEFDAEYVRLTREPILPYLRAVRLWKTYHPVNIAKNLLLNLFSLADRRLLKKAGLSYHYFFGLWITGKMDFERVIALLPMMPEKHDLELVLHAGQMLESEVTDEYNKKDFIKEHISGNRLLELRTVERLQKWQNSSKRLTGI